MKSESKTAVKKFKNRFVDLDSTLLSLKHSRLSRSLADFSTSIPSSDFLTKIGMNVLERAQAVRTSLMNSVSSRKKSASTKTPPVMKKAVTMKAAAPKKSAKPAKKSPPKKSPTKSKKK